MSTRRNISALLVGLALVAIPTGPALAVPASDPDRPGVSETGYTDCWEMYPELADLDPYDARTWPDDATCAPHQDVRAGFTGTVTASNMDSGEGISRTFARVWTAGSSQVVTDGTESLGLRPGETVTVGYAMTFTFPARDTATALDRDGLPTAPVDAATELRTTGPTIDPIALPGLQITLDCDQLVLPDVTGQTVTINCDAIIVRDGDAEASTPAVVFQLFDPYATRIVEAGNASQWTSSAGAWDGLPVTVEMLPAASGQPVDPPTLEEPREPTPELAATGLEAGIVVPLALALVAGGIALMLTTRRRTT